MKATGRFRIALSAFLLMALNACAVFQRTPQTALVGTWKNSLGSVWIIREDGTFEVDLDQDDKRDGWGKWRVEGDTVTLKRSGGIRPKGCDGKGIYRFSRPTPDSLDFTLVEDKCKLRVKNVARPWKRKS